MRLKRVCILLVFTAAWLSIFAQEQGGVLLKSAKIFNSRTGVFTDNVDVLIVGDEIQSVGKDLDVSILPNTQVLDLTGHTIIPGLIDMHTHVLESINPDIPGVHGVTVNVLTEHDIYRAIRAVSHLNSYLYAGFTTIRDVGNSGRFGDVALRKAINSGFIESPRIFVSGPIMSSIGGQIAGVLQQHQDVINEEYRIIKSKDDAIQAVREHVNQGVDLIKICTDNSPNRTYLTIEEIQLITSTAHEYGLKVCAHANTPASIMNAIEGNIDGIEHAYLISDSLSKELKALRVPITVTDFYLSNYGLKYLKENNIPEASIDFIRKTISERLRMLIRNDNILVFGSDIYVNTEVSRGDIAKNILISYNENYDIPIYRILQMSTYNAALTLGKEDSIGNIEPGLKADLLILNGDLNSDISVLNEVKIIIKGGAVLHIN